MTEVKNNTTKTVSKNRQKTILNTFIEKKSKQKLPKEKVKCPHCKTKILDLAKHLKKCHANPVNIPKTTINWEHVEDYNLIEEFLFKNPPTEMMKAFNNKLAPHGNPFEQPIEELVDYMKTLPKGQKEKLLHKRLHSTFTEGIELRLLIEDEFVNNILDKIRRGYRFPCYDNKLEDESTEDRIRRSFRTEYKNGKVINNKNSNSTGEIKK